MDGPSQTLPILYSAPHLDFNDITSGSNLGGYSAGPGYDMVTGLGTPNSDLVAYSLIGQNFYLSNGVLTVNGDQLRPNGNDTITIDQTSAGGVQITLNGEVVTLVPGTVSAINVNTDGGTNTVNVHGVPFGVTLDIQGGGVDTVNVGSSGSVQGIRARSISRTGPTRRRSTSTTRPTALPARPRWVLTPPPAIPPGASSPG